MEPAAAAAVLRRALKAPKAPTTVADASVASGLATRDAEAGLTWLTSEYRGHLRVTEDGDLVHLFPTGFTKPWETREAAARAIAAIGRAFFAAGRFIVRTWLLVVMISYALIFVALLLGLTFARQGSNDRDSGAGLGLLGGLFRMIADALFWTFHPFSPLSYGYGYGYGHQGRGVTGGEWANRRAGKTPFYEKVNRFVFGPPVPKEDPHAGRARVLEEIREQRGRITLADVMRVTGLPRDQADPLMARLMLDHDGEVDVSEGGGIVYRFEALRRSAAGAVPSTTPSRTRAAWDRPLELPPLTGNPAGSNVGVAALNLFNILASAWVLNEGLTLRNIAFLFQPHPRGMPLVLPDTSLPLALGLIPLVFSTVLFVLPAIRAVVRTFETKKLAAERGRLAVLREVVTHAGRREPVSDESLRKVVRVATGVEPTSKEMTRQVVDLGGDVDIGPEGEVRYRFAELEADAEAAEEERERAPDAEARLGAVVFASDQ